MKIVIKKNVFAIAAIFLFASFLIFAEDQPQNPFSEIKSTSEIIPTAQLLAGYLERDSDLKKLAISLQQEELSGAITKLDSGFDISLSTGDMTFKFNNDGNGATAFSVNPKVEASLPGRLNLKTSVSGKVAAGTQENDADEKKDTDDVVSNISLKLSADIISSSGLKKEINLLKAERSIIEAERSLKTKVLDKENSFYTDYKKLLSSISSIIAKEKTYYDD